MSDNNCCRTCLSTNNLNPIFQNPDESENYSRLLYMATGLQILILDNLPQKICTNCINTINQYIEFRQQCHITHTKLMSRIQNRIGKKEVIDDIDTTDNDTSDDEVLAVKAVNNDIKKLNEKKESGVKVKTEETVDIEMKPFVEFEMTVKEVLKKKNFEFINFVPRKRVKLKYVTLGTEGQTKSKPEDYSIGPFKCKICDKLLKTIKSLNSHYKIHRERKVVCEYCGRKFISKRQLVMHCRSKHGYEKTDKCSYCDYRGSNAELVKIHERIHTGERPYVCSLCGAAFHRRSTYLQHVPIHLPEKTVPCPECPALFKSVTLMRIHRNRHRTRRMRELARAKEVQYIT